MVKNKNKKEETHSSQGINPSEADVKNLLELYQSGQLSDAEKLAQSLTERFPKHQFGWKVLGAVLKLTGRISESLAVSQKSVQLDHQDAQAHSNLGITLLELGRLDEALLSLKQAIVLKPAYAEAYFNLGATQQKLDRLDEAKVSYIQAIALKPDYAEAHYNLGNTYKKMCRLDAAEASYMRAIALKPNYAQALNNLGITLQELNRLDEAGASFRKAIKSDTNLGAAYLGLSYSLAQHGNFEEARDLHVKGLELSSVKTVTTANLKSVIPKFSAKIQQQRGIPTFFDNLVTQHLTDQSSLEANVCSIFEAGQLSKENRFVSFFERAKTIQMSMPSHRLFNGIPFAASQGIHSLIKWKEHSLYKTSFDLVIYWMIMQDVQPDVIIELGSGDGGSAVWLADMACALGLDCQVYSFDINKPDLNHERVTFIEYDLMEIDKQTELPYWEHFSGKKLLIEDAHVNLKSVLYLFDNILRKDDYLIVEDSDIKQEIIEDFAGEREPKYKLDQYFLDFFGTNITCSKNSIFKVF